MVQERRAAEEAARRAAEETARLRALEEQVGKQNCSLTFAKLQNLKSAIFETETLVDVVVPSAHCRMVASCGSHTISGESLQNGFHVMCIRSSIR